MNSKKSMWNMVLYLTGNFTSLMGTNVYSFAMSFFILSVTGSSLSFSISLLLSMLPRLILGPFAGVWADRFDRKKMVLIFDGLSGVVMLSMFALSTMYGLQLWMIYLSTFLLSVCNTLFGIAFGASIPNLVMDEHLGKINSFNQSTMSLSNILGPILGGLIYAVVAPELFLLINGISFLLSTLSESFINFKLNAKEQVPTEDVKEESVFQQMKEGFLYTKKIRMIYELIKGALFTNFFFSSVSIGLPVIIVLTLNQNEKILGTVNSGFAIGMFVFSLILAMKKKMEFNIKNYCIMLGAIGVLVLGMALPLMVNTLPTIYIVSIYTAIAIIMGSIVVSLNVPVMVAMQQLIAEEYRGRVSSVVQTGCTAIVPLATLLFGFLYEKVSPHIVLICCGISILIVAAVIFYNMTYKASLDLPTNKIDDVVLEGE